MRRRRAEEETQGGDETQVPESKTRLIEAIPIPMGDPLETLLLPRAGFVVLRDLELESETVDTLREAGVELIVPLIGQGAPRCPLPSAPASPISLIRPTIAGFSAASPRRWRRP